MYVRILNTSIERIRAVASKERFLKSTCPNIIVLNQNLWVIKYYYMIGIITVILHQREFAPISYCSMMLTNSLFNLLFCFTNIYTRTTVTAKLIDYI